jgi:hypothetical protein
MWKARCVGGGDKRESKKIIGTRKWDNQTVFKTVNVQKDT